jgi:uncharacterized protein YkwD
VTLHMEDIAMPVRRAFLLGVSATVLSGCTTFSLFSSISPDDRNAVDETGAVLPMINALRKGNGLSTLAEDKAAGRAARDQADRMARYGEMEHNIGVGANFADRMKRMGVRLQAAENIAEGQTTPERAFEAWVNSPKHLENMLGPYKGMGVAVARNSASGNRPYWSMVLSN